MSTARSQSQLLSGRGICATLLLLALGAAETRCQVGTVAQFSRLSETSVPSGKKAEFGEGLSRLGDLDGDGVGDLLAGSPRGKPGSKEYGVLSVLFMNADGTVRARQVISEGLGGLSGAITNNDKVRFGISVTVLGDVNGDGVSDVAVGGSEDDDGGDKTGAVWILFMTAQGTVASQQKISALAGGFSGQLDKKDLFGSAVAGLGDLDGDQVPDLAVGAPGDDDGDKDNGAVWVLFLRTDGTVKAAQKISETVGGWTVDLSQGSAFGTSVAALGDVNGDGLTDIAVGAPESDGVAGSGSSSSDDDDDDGQGEQGVGAVWMLTLDSAASVTSSLQISESLAGFTGELNKQDHFGDAVERLGDLDGDGVADLAVGAGGTNAGKDKDGAVWLLSLNADETVKAHSLITRQSGALAGKLDDKSRFGSGLAWLGDLDGDGQGELAVGAPDDGDDGNDHGAVFVLSLERVSSGFSCSGSSPYSEVVPATVMNAVGLALPEKPNAGADFLHSKYDPTIVVAQACTVSVTFLWETSGLRNSLGYFTFGYDATGAVVIQDRQLIFPNASLPPGGTMASGASLCLPDINGNVRTFAAGTRIGFFLVAGGFDASSQIKNWNPALATIPSTSPGTNLLEAQGVFTTLDAINPEMFLNDAASSRHVAVLKMSPFTGYLGGDPFLLLGFEDLDRHRNADNDFNELVFSVRSAPAAALVVNSAATYSTADADGDGVIDVSDAYPDDASRSVVLRYPTQGFDAVGLEDLYPALGDADYNDAVVAYAFQLVQDAQGRVKDLTADFHLLARGSMLDHRLGLHIPGVPDGASGTLAVERFLSDAGGSHSVETVKSIAEFISKDQRCIETLIPSTIAALPAAPGQTFVNTSSLGVDKLAASSRLVMTFDTPIDAATLGTVPYDLYFLVDHGLWYDVHMPGWPGLPGRPPWLPDESGAAAFLDEQLNPWVIQVPYDWRFPKEQVPISTVYPGFLTWAGSAGGQNQSWYDTVAVGAGALVAQPPQVYLAPYAWTIDRPIP